MLSCNFLPMTEITKIFHVCTYAFAFDFEKVFNLSFHYFLISKFIFVNMYFSEQYLPMALNIPRPSYILKVSENRTHVKSYLP